MKVETGYKPGQKIKIKRTELLDNGLQEKRIAEVTVVKQYPHFVLVENSKGIRYSITNAEIYSARVKAVYGENGKPKERERTKWIEHV